MSEERIAISPPGESNVPILELETNEWKQNKIKIKKLIEECERECRENIPRLILSNIINNIGRRFALQDWYTIYQEWKTLMAHVPLKMTDITLKEDIGSRVRRMKVHGGKIYFISMEYELRVETFPQMKELGGLPDFGNRKDCFPPENLLIVSLMNTSETISYIFYPNETDMCINYVSPVHGSRKNRICLMAHPKKMASVGNVLFILTYENELESFELSKEEVKPIKVLKCAEPIITIESRDCELFVLTSDAIFKVDERNNINALRLTRSLNFFNGISPNFLLFFYDDCILLHHPLLQCLYLVEVSGESFTLKLICSDIRFQELKIYLLTDHILSYTSYGEWKLTKAQFSVRDLINDPSKTFSVQSSEEWYDDSDVAYVDGDLYIVLLKYGYKTLLRFSK